MAAPLTRISADGHAHIYPEFRAGLAFDCLLANLDRNARLGRQWNPLETARLALLAERSDCGFFEQLRSGRLDPLDAGLEIVESGDEACLTLLHRGARKIWLVAGRQINTRERLEILGLAMTDRVPDGLSARETLERIAAAKGCPVLPWSPGKWMGARGRLARELAAPAMGDSSLRPLGWPEPAPLRAARRNGRPVLPGSDPLPLPGEERQLGAYGFLYEGPFDAGRPTASVRIMLAGDAGLILPAGRRNSLLQVISRLHCLHQAKKKN